MQTIPDSYFTAYRNLKLTRDEDGVLVVQLHSNGGPLTFTAEAHTEVVDAFYRISQDRANKIVILTGAGGDFMTGVDWESFKDVSDPDIWSQIHDEGVQVLENIANIRVQSSRQSRGVRTSTRSMRCWPTSLWPQKARPSTTWATMRRASCLVTASLRPGAIVRERGGRKVSCSTRRRLRRLSHASGEWLPRSCQTARPSPAHRNWRGSI